LVPQGVAEFGGRHRRTVAFRIKHLFYLLIYLHYFLKGGLPFMLDLSIVKLLIVGDESFEALFEQADLPLLLSGIYTPLYFCSQHV
jgi:hypothetical protein